MLGGGSLGTTPTVWGNNGKRKGRKTEGKQTTVSSVTGRLECLPSAGEEKGLIDMAGEPLRDVRAGTILTKKVPLVKGGHVLSEGDVIRYV